MKKWSVVTNIHWKFEDFWANGFGATKVYYLPFWSKDGVKDTTLDPMTANVIPADLSLFCQYSL